MKAIPTFVLCAAALMTLASTQASSQGYPSRPVRLIIPYPPGGSTDIVGRVLAQKLAELWSQQVIVDNRTGASGMIGTESAKRATPDGYTIVMGVIGSLSVNPAIYPKVPYDPVRDFAPITLTGNVINLLVAHPSVRVGNVKELIALAKARPGQVTFASSSFGAAPHLALELFKIMAQVDIVHVPYKGGGPAIADLVGGQVSLSFASMPSSVPHVRTGRLRALAVSAAQRSLALPEIPTVAESGLPGFVVTDWQGVLAPAGTPPDLIGKLNADVSSVLKLPDVREKLSALGMELLSSSPQEFADYIKSEIAKWATVVKQAGIKVE